MFRLSQTCTDLTGDACAIGEHPIKGLLDPKAMVILDVGEALTNFVWARITALSDWMQVINTLVNKGTQN